LQTEGQIGILIEPNNFRRVNDRKVLFDMLPVKMYELGTMYMHHNLCTCVTSYVHVSQTMYSMHQEDL